MKKDELNDRIEHLKNVHNVKEDSFECIRSNEVKKIGDVINECINNRLIQRMKTEILLENLLMDANAFIEVLMFKNNTKRVYLETQIFSDN